MQEDGILFSRLRLFGWRQFHSIELDFDDRLTVLTGANGSGKSTLLNILSKHYSWERPYLATPSSSEVIRYLSGMYRSLIDQLFGKPITHKGTIGELFYSNGKATEIHIPEDGPLQYGVSMSKQQPVAGLHIFSHSQLPTYQRIGQIPANVITPEQAYSIFNSELMSRIQGGSGGYSPSYRLKEALISMAIFGAGNKYVTPNKVALQTFEGFIRVLTSVLPQELGFEDLIIRHPDVLLKTKTGEFLLESSSGGVINLIDLAWQIYTFSITHGRFVVSIDEPENHLHPAMQRVLLPNLLRTFPKVQFIVATHSPFMVSAVQNAAVYALKYEEGEGRSGIDLPPAKSVRSIKLDTINKAATAAEILRDVLGVPTTFPDWVQGQLNDLVARYRDRPFSNETLNSLRTELVEMGLGELYPQALADLVPK